MSRAPYLQIIGGKAVDLSSVPLVQLLPDGAAIFCDEARRVVVVQCPRNTLKEPRRAHVLRRLGEVIMLNPQWRGCGAELKEVAQ